MISLKPIKLKPTQLSIEQINTYINQSNIMTIEEANKLINNEIYIIKAHKRLWKVIYSGSFNGNDGLFRIGCNNINTSIPISFEPKEVEWIKPYIKDIPEKELYKEDILDVMINLREQLTQMIEAEVKASTPNRTG